MTDLTLYSLPFCPHCETLKTFLDKAGIVYKNASLEDPAAITELRIEGCFAIEAPVLQIQNKNDIKFLESGVMFPGGNLDQAAVLYAVMEELG